jgi:hypothetical protein
MGASDLTGGAMKIALFAIGSLGDVMPFIRLGTHLKRHGHLVVFYSGSRFAPLVEDFGLARRGRGMGLVDLKSQDTKKPQGLCLGVSPQPRRAASLASS